MERDVFYEAGSAYRSGATNRGEDSRADSPVLAIDIRIFCEHCGVIEFKAIQNIVYGLNVGPQCLMSRGLGFGQYGCQTAVVTRLYAGDTAFVHVFFILKKYWIIYCAQ